MSRRGFEPADALNFTGMALTRLRQAQYDACWLLGRGYTLDTVMDLVGRHYQLTVRQRLAVQRTTAAPDQVRRRRDHELMPSAATQGNLLIDGFNLIINLEVALSGGPLLLGNDGVLRDLAGLRGTYHLIEQTDQAIDLLAQTLARLHVQAATIYLDAPVSNSGQLRARLQARLATGPVPVSIELAPDADRLLAGQRRIVSADAVLLDRCESWLNLARLIVEQNLPEAWIIDLSHVGLPAPL